MTAKALRVEDRSIGTINITPLIDVMLVLLIMFVITIPVATHVNEFELPAGPASETVDPVVNRLAVTQSDAILWNGSSVSAGQLAALLAETRRLKVEPELQFQPEPSASYALAASVLGIIKRSGVTKFGFVGNERFSDFNKSASAK